MKELSDSLPASELEHLCHVNTFKLSKLNEKERNETATISNLLHLFTLHVTKTFSFNILKTVSLKIEKKLVLKRQAKVK